MNESADAPALCGEAHFHRAVLRTNALQAFDGAEQDIALIHLPYLQHFAQGELHLKKNDYAKAAEGYELVIQSLPKERVPIIEPVKAFQQMETCYSKLGNTAMAESAKKRLKEFLAGLR